jgi:glycosyltransferase involved in cell wall biosynthesis
LKILYFCPASYGGIADYVNAQANALSALGADVTTVCGPNYINLHKAKYEVAPILRDTMPGEHDSNRLPRTLSYIHTTLSNFKRLVRYIEQTGFRYVMLGSYVEYLAPVWAPRLRKLERRGVVFGAIVHDPIRDFVIGPRWWHRWSVASGYSFLREAFVHDDMMLDTVVPSPKLRTSRVAHGPYQFHEATLSRALTRELLGVPPSAKLMLSFGHIRDSKNLDLTIQAMALLPDVYLLVAGSEQSSGQRPVSFYQELAAEVGVADRCRWRTGPIPEDDVANLFVTSDLVLLCYSRSFVSASGVLNTAVWYRRPVIASSGGGPLRGLIEQYSLGRWVEPDDLESIVDGLKKVMLAPPQPLWNEYCLENSWEQNARTVLDRFASHDEPSK